MKFVLFYHSLLSDWNHGNAHYLRGVVAELLHRGHTVEVYEPKNSWSFENLTKEFGAKPLAEFRAVYPTLKNVSRTYLPGKLNLEKTLADADVVIVHEWSDHDLVRQVGACRRSMQSFTLFFHDTHHRAVSDPAAMSAYDLSQYDAVLAFGKVLHDLYLKNKWTHRAFTWHEAADTQVFRPIADQPKEGDLVWIGNWGDGERTAELQEFLLDPIKKLRLKARIHGVRYPTEALAALRAAGVSYGNWLANYKAPDVFARFRVAVHVPRRPYVQALPGIPTIRVFEALACGIPLICAPWPDAEHLFTPGQDYLQAKTGAEMTRHLKMLLNEPEAAHQLAAHGHRTILSRHTCAHRVDELLNIIHELKNETRPALARPRKPQSLYGLRTTDPQAQRTTGYAQLNATNSQHPQTQKELAMPKPQSSSRPRRGHRM